MPKANPICICIATSFLAVKLATSSMQDGIARTIDQCMICIVPLVVRARYLMLILIDYRSSEVNDLQPKQTKQICIRNLFILLIIYI